MPAGEVWRLEWRIARSRPRRLAWSVAVPAALLVPVAASGAAAPHRATVYALLVVFFGLFGSAAPVVRDGERGWIQRLLLTGYGARAWLLERTAAHAVLDALQLAPGLALVLWLEGAATSPLAAAAGATLLALLAANLLGAVAGAVVRSLAEGALACAALGLGALHLAGAFRGPAPGTWQETAAAANPFLPVVSVFREVAATAGARGGSGPIGGGELLAGWAGPAAATLVLIAGAGAAAPRIAARLSGSGGQL